MMNESCGCCEGLEVLTPITQANRPGLNTLVARVGTHATFLETMKARLSSSDYPALHDLTTRKDSDFSIAFLDAWATVADVLSFYQERIINESYLRTATERRSILELARLVGYTLRPGVASSVYLAFTLENGYDVEIPEGTPAQNLPSPGQQLQTFETAEKLEARAAWNQLKPRTTRPQQLEEVLEVGRLKLRGGKDNWQRANPTNLQPVNLQSSTYPSGAQTIYFKGIATKLQLNNPLLIDLGDEEPQLYRVMEVTPDSANSRTAVTLEPWLTAAREKDSTPPDKPITSKEELVKNFLKPLPDETIPPRNSVKLHRDLKTSFRENSDTNTQLQTSLHPGLKSLLYKAWENATVTEPSPVKAYAMRVQASVFGHNAPLIPKLEDGNIQGYEEWPLTKLSRETIVEFFAIAISWARSPIGSNNRINITTIIKIDDNQTNPVERELPSEPFTIEFPEANEKIQVTVSEVQNDPIAPFKVNFDFDKRDIQVAIGFDARGQLEVTSSSNNLTTVVSQAVPPTVPQVTRPISGSPTLTPEGIGAELLTVETSEQQALASAISTGNLPEIRVSGYLHIHSDSIDTQQPSTEQPRIVSLDTTYKQILPGSWVVLEKPSANNQKELIISKALQVSVVSRADYGITASSSQIELDKTWIDLEADSFDVIRGTTVYAQSEALELAEAPLDPVSEPICGKYIELERLYDGLQSGRWLIVSGDRTDIPGVSSIKYSELVMLADVEQNANRKLRGDKTHSTLVLANDLAYCYDPHTVAIYGNVVKATHGETRIEVLGSGDASKALQQFALRQSPLTYVAASTPEGIKSTLEVRVNDILWHETDSLAGLKPTDRNFITKTDNESKTTVIFGNGEKGARLPTGIENVKAVYRTGIGKPGNVPAEQISLLAKRPLGLKGVINPLRASGGADPESRDQARRNAPLAVMALDRLVSVQDYEDFARTFAGIGKASAIELSDGRRQLVHLTIAGVDDIPIDQRSDLYANLLQALHGAGDPYQPIKVDVRSLMQLVISAKVNVLPDYKWEFVEPQVRTALLDTFSFERRELGQDALLSEVISTIQQVPGVAYVDVDTFGGIPEKEFNSSTKTLEVLTSQQIEQKVFDLLKNPPLPRVTVNLAKSQDGIIYPAQLAFLNPDVKDTLILTELTA